ncbi:hypothetical protein AX17_005943 [Amanita inopinata Kibby_2008]|nr:hypothetical protein AX17_005943 [Amanita inopinata Kibby_2008]
MKQGTLGFASAKRTASTSTAGKHKKVAQVAPVTLTSSGSNSSREGSVHIPIVEDGAGSLQPSKSYKRVKEDQAFRAAKRSRTSADGVVTASSQEAEKGVEEVERLSLNPNDRRWRKIHEETKERMGYAMPVHAQDQNKIHEILRVFDLSYEYGPCIGVSRLERWERAQALGLDPPIEIREILDTLEGTEKPEFSQCVFYDEV